MYWHPRNQWEVATWPVKKGAQISHLYLEDIRRYIWLLWVKHKGFKKADCAASCWTWGQSYSLSPNPDAVLFKAGQYLCYYWGNYWYNRVPLTRRMMATEGYGPPKDIHPRPNEWITSTWLWHLAPDTMIYHHYDVNAGRRQYHYHGGSTVNDEAPEQCWWNSSEILPPQTDPRELEPPIQYQDTKRVDWQIKSKVKFERDIITTPDTMGAIYSAFDVVPYWDSNHDHYWLSRAEPFTGRRMSGSQYTNGARIPCGSAFGFTETSSDGFSRNGCRKTGSSYQAMVESVIDNGGELSVDETFHSNWLAYRRYGNSSFVETEEDKCPEYAPVGSIFWGCNSSGFELYLKKKGICDWYFDTDYPFVTLGHAGALWITENLPTQQTSDDYPTPVGTWRRTWHNSLGRIRPLIRPHEMGTPAMNNYTGRNAEPVITDSGESTALRGTYEVWYPSGTFVNNEPSLSDFFETIVQPVSVGPVAKTGLRGLVKISGDYTGKIKYANVVVMAHDIFSYIDCYVMKPPVYEDGYTILELDKDAAGYPYLCHDSRVSARHDPVGVEYVLEDDQWVAKPEYKLTADLVNEMKDLLHGITFERIGNPSMSFGQCIVAAVARDGGTYWSLINATIRPVEEWFIFQQVGIGGANDPEYYFPYYYWSTVPIGYHGYLTGFSDEGWGQNQPPKVSVGIEFRLPTDENAAYNNYQPKYGAYGSGSYYDGGCGTVGWQAFAIKCTSDDPLFTLCKTVKLRFKYTDKVYVTNLGPVTGPDAVYGQGTCGMWTSYIRWDTTASPLPDPPYTFKYAYASLEVNGDILVARPAGGVSPRKFGTVPGANCYNSARTFGGYFYYQQGSSVASVQMLQLAMEDPGVVLCWDFTLAPDWAFERDLTCAIEPTKTPYDDTKPPHPDGPAQIVDPQAYWEYVPQVYVKDENGNYVVDPATGKYKVIAEHFHLRIKTQCCLCEDLEGSNPVYYQFATEDESFISQLTTSRTVDDIFREYQLAEVGEQRDYIIRPTGSTECPTGTVTRVYCLSKGRFVVGDYVKFVNAPDLIYKYALIAVTDNYIEFDSGKFISATFTSQAYVYRDGEVVGYDLSDWRLEPFYQIKIKMRTKDNNAPLQNVGKWGELVVLQDPTRWPMETREDYGGTGVVI